MNTQYARKVGDDQLPRAWSKHTTGTSANKKLAGPAAPAAGGAGAEAGAGGAGDKKGAKGKKGKGEPLPGEGEVSQGRHAGPDMLWVATCDCPAWRRVCPGSPPPRNPTLPSLHRIVIGLHCCLQRIPSCVSSWR